jgi:hypothetical protein
VRPLLDEHPDDRQGAGRRFMDEMHLHRVMLAMDRVLTWTMKVRLDQFVVRVSDGQGIAF